MYRYKSGLKRNARLLRKNMTDAELRLWSKIRKRQIANLQFYRQKPLGKYIVDFYCHNKKLVIEIDGGQHFEIKNIREDRERDNYFKNRLKLRVLRFTNLEVLQNIEGVFDEIIKETN